MTADLDLKRLETPEKMTRWQLRRASENLETVNILINRFRQKQRDDIELVAVAYGMPPDDAKSMADGAFRDGRFDREACIRVARLLTISPESVIASWVRHDETCMQASVPAFAVIGDPVQALVAREPCVTNLRTWLNVNDFNWATGRIMYQDGENVAIQIEQSNPMLDEELRFGGPDAPCPYILSPTAIMYGS